MKDPKKQITRRIEIGDNHPGKYGKFVTTIQFLTKEQKRLAKLGIDTFLHYTRRHNTFKNTFDDYTVYVSLNYRFEKDIPKRLVYTNGIITDKKITKIIDTSKNNYLKKLLCDITESDKIEYRSPITSDSLFDNK